jgi:hypothetical protein
MNKPYTFIKACTLLITVALTACGGGGGDSAPPANPPAPTTPSATAVGTIDNTKIGNGATIEAATGGSITSVDSKITLTIPAGALAADTLINIFRITNTAHGGIGGGFRLEPDGQSFSTPVTLTFSYTDGDLDGSDPAMLGAAFQTATGFWQWLGTPVINTSNHTVSVTTTHFTDFSLVKGYQLQPASKTVRVNNTQALEVMFCYPQSVAEDDPQPLAYACDSSSSQTDVVAPMLITEWSVNGIPGGNSTVGTVTGNGPTATYTAPSTKPVQNTVAVSAKVDLGGRGKQLVVSNITITETETYIGEILIGVNEGNAFTQMQIDGTIDVTFTLDSIVGDSKIYLPTGSLTATFAPVGCVAQNATLPLDVTTNGYGLTVLGSLTPVFTSSHYWTLSAGVITPYEMAFNCDSDPDLEMLLNLQVFIGTAGCDADITATPYDDVTHLHGTYHCTDGSAVTDAYWDFTQ